MSDENCVDEKLSRRLLWQEVGLIGRLLAFEL